MRKKQTTNYNVGDVLYERDVNDPELILDTLYIMEADHGDPTKEDVEDYLSYYTFYSFLDGDVWHREPLDNGRIIYYERA